VRPLSRERLLLPLILLLAAAAPAPERVRELLSRETLTQEEEASLVEVEPKSVSEDLRPKLEEILARLRSRKDVGTAGGREASRGPDAGFEKRLNQIGVVSQGPALDRFYENAAAKTGAVTARAVPGIEGGDLPRANAPEIDPALVKGLMGSLDRFQETREIRRFLQDGKVRVDMSRTPGAAAVYDDDINTIIISDDFKKGETDTILPTFYHEAAHAQWHALGLDGGLIENEFRSWTVANRLTYEMVQDPAFRKRFLDSVQAIGAALDSQDARAKRVDAGFQKARATEGLGAVAAWTGAYWNELKEWWNADEKETVREHFRANPEVLAGYVANLSSYRDFCKGQTEFLGGVQSMYDKHVGWQVTIPVRKDRLAKELEELKAHPRQRPPFKVFGESRYALIAKDRTAARFSLKPDDSVLLDIEPSRTLGHATFSAPGSRYPKSLLLEVAEDASRRARLLRYRSDIPFDRGGLLVFEKQERHDVSMEGIWTSVDVVFLDDRMSVTRIFTAVPGDEHKVRPEADIRADQKKLEKTEIYWKQWLADDVKWRKDRPDYCSDARIQELTAWIERLEKAAK
jgi:uncharacterized membrane protein (UPF0127 family)